jgi:DNA-binding IclR family transcriptional regulator
MAPERTADETPESTTSGGVDAVDRALVILQAFDVGRERLSLAALAKETGFYKSTILRLARSLERGGYLHREHDGDFMLGAEPLRLAAICRRSSQLEPKVRPVLRALRDSTRESSSFWRRLGDRRQCLYREETLRAVRDHVMEGDVHEIATGAAGHVLTEFENAQSTQAEAWHRAGKLPMTSFGERDPETAAGAVPVFGPDGLVGALTISGPRTRITPEFVAEIGPMLFNEGRSLSRRLGGWPR